MMSVEDALWQYTNVTIKLGKSMAREGATATADLLALHRECKSRLLDAISRGKANAVADAMQNELNELDVPR